MKADRIRRLLAHGFSIAISLNGKVERYYPTKQGMYALMYEGHAICGFCGKPYGDAQNWFSSCRCEETMQLVSMTDLYRRVLDLQKASEASARIDSKSMSIVLVA